MGKLNLIKANFTGKVGQLVGAKWKNVSTVRSFTKPAYSDSPAQRVIRNGFGSMTSFAALFTDQIKRLSALDVKGMSVRNAIIKLNKAQITTGAFDPSTLQISRGGLLPVSVFSATVPAGLATMTATWTPSTAVTLSEKAKLVVVAVEPDTNFAVVGEALQSTGTLTLTAGFPANKPLNIYRYLLDYRSSMKVASKSDYSTVTTPAA